MDEGTLLAGRYLLVDVLGVGGMGRVWRAQDQLLDRPVAVKVLAPHLAADERSSARLRAEASRAAKVRHPNVVQVLDAVFDEGVAAIVLQLIDGPDLQAFVPSGGLPTDAALTLLDGIAAGLAAVHAAGVVHRDVTPRNVLLDEGVPRLTDFGIARSVVATSTATQTVRGSVGYLAPEQASGGEVGPTADVYALACLATFLLTGRPPFEAEAPVGVVHQHLTATPDDVRTRAPGVPEAVAAGIAAALAKKPSQRPQDVRSFMVALGRPMADSLGQTSPAAGGETTIADVASQQTRVLPQLATTAGVVAPLEEPAVEPTVAMLPADEDTRGTGRRVLVMAVVALLMLVAVAASQTRGDEAPLAESLSEASSEAASPEPEPELTPEPSPEPPPEPSPEPVPDPLTPQEAVAAALSSLRTTLTDQRTAGGMDAKAFEKLDDKLGKVDDKLRDGKARDAEDELRSFRSELTKRTDEGDVTPEAEATLLSAARDLESALAGLEDTSDNDKGDDERDDD